MSKQLTEQYIRAFDAKDLAGVAALLADDFALEDPVVKRIEGKQPALAAIGAIFAGCRALSFKAKRVYADGDTCFIEFTLDLDAVRLQGVDIVEWRDGKMHELRAYLDIPKG
jgi:ketosteroid isomerase-like protein